MIPTAGPQGSPGPPGPPGPADLRAKLDNSIGFGATDVADRTNHSRDGALRRDNKRWCALTGTEPPLHRNSPRSADPWRQTVRSLAYAQKPAGFRVSFERVPTTCRTQSGRGEPAAVSKAERVQPTRDLNAKPPGTYSGWPCCCCCCCFRTYNVNRGQWSLGRLSHHLEIFKSVTTPECRRLMRSVHVE